MKTNMYPVLIAAHRGTAGGNIPCNSIPAYERALQDGADIIELDISRSRDGILFCFHPGKEPIMYADPTLISELSGEEAAKRFLRNQDLDETVYTAPLLDDVLEQFKHRCQIAVDKFWRHIPEIAACIRRHGMEQEVMCKIPGRPEYYQACAQLAPDLPILPVIKKADDFTGTELERAIRQIGVEVIFAVETDPVASDHYIQMIHRRDQLLWVNSIVYNRRDILSAGHTDDVAAAGDPDAGWGWLVDKEFDIIQTDWTAQLRSYLAQR